MADKPKRPPFDFPPGRVLGGKYVVDAFLGSGWEGEAYRVTETRTGIHRAVKVFYPARNVRDKAVRTTARKLERLRHCPLIIQYHHTEAFRHRGQVVTGLVSELVEGEALEDFVKRQPRRRLQSFEALHLLHQLATGLVPIHEAREYHGDLHDRNVLIRRRGIAFDLKLLDFYHWGRAGREKSQEDIIQLIRVFYDAVGGRQRYGRQPPEVKAICYGLRRDLITSKFPTRQAIEHDERHVVLNLVGEADMRIEIGSATAFAPRDTLLLGSDGLFDNWTFDRIVDRVRHGALPAVAGALAAATRERMTAADKTPSKPDDLTFVIARRTSARSAG